MNNKIEQYLLNAEDAFEDTFQWDNNELKISLANLLNKLPNIKNEEWIEIFNRMSSNTIDGKMNINETYIIATSKIIRVYAIKSRYLFAQDKKDMTFFNTMHWQSIPHGLFKEFLKSASNKIGIPEYIASSATFINKLQKQFSQDAYFEKSIDNEATYINLKNGTLIISSNAIKLEVHHPKHCLDYILDFDYDENERYDDLLETIKSIINSNDVIKTLQQSIAQILIHNYKDYRKICLHGIDGSFQSDFIQMLSEVIPQELIAKHFKNDNATLHDLFVPFERIGKDAESLTKILFIPCTNFSKNTLIKNVCTNKVAILNWLLHGVKEILKNKKIYIAQESVTFRQKFHLTKQFVQDSHLIKTPNHSKSIVSTYEKIFRQYQSFCEFHDEEPLGRGTFNKELKALGFESTRRESGNVWFAKFA